MDKGIQDMSETTTQQMLSMEAPPRINEVRRFFRVFFSRRIVVFGMIIVALFFVMAAFAELLAPYDPYQPDEYNTLLQPSREHLLGTDAIGRDTLSRIIYGARISLMVGVIALGVAAIVGTIIGLLAGYYGGVVQTVIMRFIDALMAFPMIVLALVISAVLGGGIRNVMIALGIALIPAYARLMCGQTLSVKENDYVMATRATGANNIRIILIHIFPNCLPPLIVMLTMMMGTTMLAEAGLSFLGIGIQAPAAAWGSMITDGYQHLVTNPVLASAPGVALMLVVFSFNIVGDGLRDALDPRLRGVI
jgi:peptide/nickel transport system permease protein